MMSSINNAECVESFSIAILAEYTSTISKIFGILVVTKQNRSHIQSHDENLVLR